MADCNGCRMVISLNQCNGALMEEKVSARYAGCGNYTKKEKENSREDSLYKYRSTNIFIKRDPKSYNSIPIQTANSRLASLYFSLKTIEV